MRIRTTIKKIRRSGKDRKVSRTAIFFLTCLLTILPFWMKSYNHEIQDWLSNRAVASTLAALKSSGHAQALLSAQDRERHGQAVRALVSLNSDTILELTGLDIISGFNEPDLLRTEGPYVIYQYRNETCILDVFLEKNQDAQSHDVVHYEVRSPHKAYFTITDAPAPEHADPQACIEKI